MKPTMILFFLIVAPHAIPLSAEVPVKVGVIAPLSGAASELGIQIRNGLLLAQEDLHDSIKFQFEDEACDAVTAVSAAQKLATQDDIKVIIGPLCSPPFLSVAPILNRAGIVFVHSSSGTQNTDKAKGAFGIEGTATVMEENLILARYVFAQSAKRLAIINFEQEWATGHANAFASAVGSLGGEIIAREVFTDPNTVDFRTQILRILSAKPDGFFIAAWNGQTANILKQARQLGLSAPAYAQYDVEDPSFLKAAGDSGEGLRYTYPFDNTRLSTVAQKFADRYRVRFGISPSFYPFNGYDLGMLVASAAQTCKNEAKCIRDRFARPVNVEGLTGIISFTPDGTITRRFIIKEIKNGQFVKVEQ